jgi:hypothetical protein
VTTAVYDTPIAFIVLRTILGFTPSEWADVTTERAGVAVDQGAARTLDRKFRVAPVSPLKDKNATTDQRVKAMIAAAVRMLEGGTGAVDRAFLLHRLDKVDTTDGLRASGQSPILECHTPCCFMNASLGSFRRSS